MTRLLPRSLLGQVMLALAGALLIAQGISAVLLYRAAAERRELAVMHAAAFQLVAGPRRAERPATRRPPPMRPDRARIRLPRPLRYVESAANPVAAGEPREARRERAIAALLEGQGVEVDAVTVTTRPLLEDPLIRAAAERYPRLHRSARASETALLVVGLKQAGREGWQVVRLPMPPPERGLIRTLLLQTAFLFIVLVGLMYGVLRRITRPLDALARRTRAFAADGAPQEPLAASGPEDVRRLIAAHNTMQARIGSMLDEKDVMLGAIGHDLKTPLAALRVRIESVEDEAARGKMAATIEDITHTLDEILALARVGRTDRTAEQTELFALAASVVEEFEDMGSPVTLASEARLTAPVHLTWLKRGLRNLVTNALRYAGAARVTVLRDGDRAVLRVDDDGPGIPEDRIDAMLEPFVRGEASRNRETGGAGLGLTLARAVAEQHGGTLLLANRPEGGLRAEIRIPL